MERGEKGKEGFQKDMTHHHISFLSSDSIEYQNCSKLFEYQWHSEIHKLVAPMDDCSLSFTIKISE